MLPPVMVMEPPEAVVALDDLVGDARQRPLHVLSGEDLDPRNEDPTARWGQSAFSLRQGSSTVRSGLSGPASRSSNDVTTVSLPKARRVGRLLPSGFSPQGRTWRAIVDRTPFTKPPENSVEYCLANSTASSITTATGTSGSAMSS